MKWWSKHKRTGSELPSFLRASLNGCKQRLVALAIYLQDRTNRYSDRKKKCMLLAFIFVFLSASAVIIIDSVRSSNKNVLTISRVKTIPLQNFHMEAARINPFELRKIMRFKKYMDSLSGTAEGRKYRDSLLRRRPHLMDSVNFLVKAFESSK